LKNGSKVRGVLLNQSQDTYIVGNIDLAYPNTEEIAEELIEKIQTNPPGEIELVVGWEAAQTGFLKVGQKLVLKVREMAREKTIENGVEVEIEKPVLKDYTFRVVGVLERAGSKDDGSYFIQLENAQRIFQKYKMVTDIGIKLQNIAKLPIFTDRLYNQKELGEIQIISLSEVKGTILNLVQTAKILVMSVAFIAIFVSLIGVMNTILMSVFDESDRGFSWGYFYPYLV
jgi:ABC-type lipoprotein release transport system permease subunit